MAAHIDAAQRAAILAGFGRTKSFRATARETGHTFATVKRAIGGGADQLSDIERLIDARVAAALAARGPVNEGPPAPRPQAPARLNTPGVHLAPKLYERTVWLSDMHYPYQDDAAINCALEFCRDWKPSLVILGGDLFDSYLISSYEKSPEQLNHHLQREFDLARPFVKAVDDLGCPVVYILGNHEARIDALIAKNPGLAKLRALEWHRMAELPARWEILPQYSRYRLGGLDFHHGDLKQGPGGRYVAARMLEDLKRSSLHGHFHRFQIYTEPDGDGVLRGGFSTGHLCNTVEAAKYCRLNRWATGFASVDMDPTSGVFEVRQHTVHDGKTRIDGKTYG